MVTINISNRAVYSLVALVIVLAVVGVAYAFTGPSGVGHTVDEIEGGVCNLDNPNNCPAVPTGNDTYIEPSGSYVRGNCQPTCNAQILQVPHGDPAPTCIDYEYLGDFSSSYACTGSNNGVICEYVSTFTDKHYYCAKKINNRKTQFIGEQFTSNMPTVVLGPPPI
jgi:hypothetical protein